MVDTKGDFFVGYLGLDYRVGETPSPMSWASSTGWSLREQGSINEIDGNGFLVGPYVSSKIASNIFFDARAMWGLSDNDDAGRGGHCLHGRLPDRAHPSRSRWRASMTSKACASRLKRRCSTPLTTRAPTPSAMGWAA